MSGSLQSRIRSAVLAGVLGLVFASCGDSRREAIAQRAHAWVESIQDTSAADSAAVAEADSAWLDSLAPVSTDDWMYFWYEVAAEKARRREVTESQKEQEGQGE